MGWEYSRSNTLGVVKIRDTSYSELGLRSQYASKGYGHYGSLMACCGLNTASDVFLIISICLPDPFFYLLNQSHISRFERQLCTYVLNIYILRGTWPRLQASL